MQLLVKAEATVNMIEAKAKSKENMRNLTTRDSEDKLRHYTCQVE